MPVQVLASQPDSRKQKTEYTDDHDQWILGKQLAFMGEESTKLAPRNMFQKWHREGIDSKNLPKACCTQLFLSNTKQNFVGCLVWVWGCRGGSLEKLAESFC
jgi:hypothetical protein